ncbi:MAG: immunoglobulin domain-containing protein [Verrucomicrobia bacterium]|nr:immunoglobulin domain-containing protein [Verrucomicrobiota bacterium]
MGTFFKIGGLAFFLFALATASVSAAPANDLFANRITISGTNVTVNGNNSGASSESGEPTGSAGGMWLYSVWYSWTAPATGVVYLSGTVTNPSFFFGVRAYHGTAVNALTPVTAAPDGGYPVAPGDTIAIQVTSTYYPYWSGGGGTGNFTLTANLIQPTPVSANDLFANAFTLAMPVHSFAGSIYGATNEPGEPLPSGMTQTLWWKFTATDSGLLYPAVNSPTFNSAIRLYAGTQLNSLTPVTAVNGAWFPISAGTTYALQLSSSNVAVGDFSLNTRFFSSRCDMFAGSEQIEGTNVTYVGNFTRATSEPGEPNNGATNTVWMSWAAPATGYVTVRKATAYQFQYYAVYTGPTVNQLQPVPLIGIGYNSIFRFAAVEGTVYHFQFSGGADNITFYLEFTPYPAVTNDNFADAQLVKGAVVYYEPKSANEATLELGEPAHLGATLSKSLWWKWQAPQHGTCSINSSPSLIPNVVTCVYKGSSVEALTFVAKGTNQLSFPITGGETYYWAAAVPTNAVGDVLYYSQINRSSAARAVPGNLLQEPSWEGTAILSAQHWGMSGSIGGYVNEQGGCDGTTWPALGGGAKIWQDFPTVPGRSYRVRFAYYVGSNLSGCCGDARIKVSWDTNQLGLAEIKAGEPAYWHWVDYVAIASNSTTRLTLENQARNVEVDAFSVVDLSAPPVIVTQPSSISAFAGGTAAFIVGVTGSTPLHYRWFFNGTVVSTNQILILEPVSVSQAGSYHVVVSNNLGIATSAAATLVVDSATNATILVQPYSGTVPEGGYFNMSVVAAGTAPLTYQWFFNNQPLADATNRNLMFPSVEPDDAGTYHVRVQNYGSAVLSLPATLRVTNAIATPGTLHFRNRFLMPGMGTNMDAPVFDIDGVTRLNGSNFVAQLYAGPSLEFLQPVGSPSPFQSGFNAGYFASKIVTMPNIAAGSSVVAQVRAWDVTKGSSFEEARVLGGRFGKSVIVTTQTGGGPTPPGNLDGLQSFSLQAGLPQFSIGIIQFVERLQQNSVLWSHQGQPGYRYVIEKKVHEGDWTPFQIVTNTTSVVTFTDQANSGAQVVFYRSRILD